MNHTHIPGMPERLHLKRYHDTRNFHVTLKQWQVFHAVNDCGGFNGAAKRLHLSQSTISYGISQLEEQLGVTLFRQDGRKAKLTEDGKVILSRSRHLMREALEIEEFAHRLRNGISEDMEVVVESGFPIHLITDTLSEYSRACPDEYILLNQVSSVQGGIHSYGKGKVICVTHEVPSGFSTKRLLDVDYVAVAKKSHPLICLNRQLTDADVADNVRIAISGSNLEKFPHFRGRSRQWQVATFDAAIQALLCSHSYAWLPKYQVERYIQDGTLKVLQFLDTTTRAIPYFLIHPKEWAQDSRQNNFIAVLESTIKRKWPGTATCLPSERETCLKTYP